MTELASQFLCSTGANCSHDPTCADNAGIYLVAAARFHQELAPNLVKLSDELLSGTYAPGPYRTFEIFEPADREISAAPFRDRVVHHALILTTGP